MKKLLSLLAVFLLLLYLVPPAFADEVPDSFTYDDAAGADQPSDAALSETPLPDSITEPPIYYYGSPDAMELSGDFVLDDVSVYSVAPVTPSSSSGLKAVILELIGSYDPVVVEYRYLNTNSSTYSYLREVQPDYPWLCSFLMFLVVVFCIFRLGGGFVGRN